MTELERSPQSSSKRQGETLQPSLRTTKLRRVAALYVISDGTYSDIEGVDCWDKDRDARTYPGPYPVVAHPPCARWGRYWFGGPSAKVRRELGDDDGCFAAALDVVERWGGVVEHPEGSHAWRMFGIVTPPKSGGWVSAGLFRPGLTCCVEQGHYGHKVRKATWLYAVGVTPAELKWGQSEGDPEYRMDEGFHSAEERARAKRAGVCRRLSRRRLSRRQRMKTPQAFRDVLLAMARSVPQRG